MVKEECAPSSGSTRKGDRTKHLFVDEFKANLQGSHFLFNAEFSLQEYHQEFGCINQQWLLS